MKKLVFQLNYYQYATRIFSRSWKKVCLGLVLSLHSVWRKKSLAIICSFVYLINILFLPDKVLYARKNGEVEELSESWLNGIKITVEDATVMVAIGYNSSNNYFYLRIWRPCVGEDPAVYPMLSGSSVALSSILQQRFMHLVWDCRLGHRKPSRWSSRPTFSNISSSAPWRRLSSRHWNINPPGLNQWICGASSNWPDPGKWFCLLSRKSLLEPADNIQKDSLCAAMTEILWKVGDRSRAVIVIPCLEVVIDPPLTFTFDGVTEKVGLTAGWLSDKTTRFDC